MRDRLRGAWLDHSQRIHRESQEARGPGGPTDEQLDETPRASPPPPYVEDLG